LTQQPAHAIKFLKGSKKMTATLDYALLAGAAYYSTRAEVNQFPVPDEWNEVVEERVADIQTGFEAISFQRGNEIVISFSGTDPNNSGLLTSSDGRTNSALANGKWSDQLLQAAKYYMDIKTANPNAVITFTGHSLGGGLAALMAVFFDVQAQTSLPTIEETTLLSPLSGPTQCSDRIQAMFRTHRELCGEDTQSA
jgi:putative lipase involved disintegration of autophagic bodies